MGNKHPNRQTSDDDLEFAIEIERLIEKQRVVVEVLGREIAIFYVDESIHAIGNYCIHQGGPVCEGKISGALFEEEGELIWKRTDEFVSCPWHGWEFEIETGRHITHPKYRIPTYDTVLIDDEVWLKI